MIKQVPGSLWFSKNVLVIAGSVQVHFSLEIFHSPNAGAKRTTERIVLRIERKQVGMVKESRED